MNNNYLKILYHLKQYEGDGKFYEIESLLGNCEEQEIKEIVEELIREGLIKCIDGVWTDLPILIGSLDRTSMYVSPDGPKYNPYKAKITFKGSKYLKEELDNIKKNNYSINIGDNSTANLIIESPNSLINNKQEIDNKVQEIINQLIKDNTISDQRKNEAIQNFNQLKEEINQGKKDPSTIQKVLTTGSEISSIGSFVISLVQLLSS